MATTRQRLRVEDHYEIIQRIEKGESRESVIKEFNLKHSSNITAIMKRKEKIQKTIEKGVKGKAKTVRDSMFPAIDASLREFVADMNTRGGTVPKSVLKEKAKELGVEFGVSDKFRASDGYLDKFMKRQGIAMAKSHGDAANVDGALVESWKESLPALISSYSPDDIFNCDELGLFFKLTPSRSYAIKGKSFRTGKHSKERVTVLLCANMSGTEKLPPLLIGKSGMPHCFRGVVKKPVRYRFNKNAWMSGVLFEEWLNSVNAKMKTQKRKVLLFLDNCSAHPMNLKFTNLTLCPLPANTTSVLQPMDQGIIKCFKCFYRKRLIRHIVYELEMNAEATVEKVKVDLLMASKWIRGAWGDVTEATIRNCFRKAGFVQGDVEAEEQMEAEENPSIEQFVGTEISMEEYASADDGVCVAGSTEENRIPDEGDNDMTDTDDEADDETGVAIQPSVREAISALKTVQMFLLYKGSGEQHEKVLDSLEDLLQRSAMESRKQTTITDFFPRLQ